MKTARSICSFPLLALLSIALGVAFLARGQETKTPSKPATNGDQFAPKPVGFVPAPLDLQPGAVPDFSSSSISFKELKTRAEKGDADAQYALGSCYDSGRGVPQDYTEAVKWFHKAAEQGEAQAQGSLPQNVNYAMKSSVLNMILESLPEISAKLPEPNPIKDRKFEDVEKETESAVALVLVY